MKKPAKVRREKPLNGRLGKLEPMPKTCWHSRLWKQWEKEHSARREKPLVLTERQWDILSIAVSFYSSRSYSMDEAVAILDIIGKNGERAYRLGVMPHPGGK